MNLNQIITKLNNEHSIRIEGQRNELDNLMNQLDQYHDTIIYGLNEHQDGTLYLEISLLDDEE